MFEVLVNEEIELFEFLLLEFELWLRFMRLWMGRSLFMDELRS